MKSLITGGDQLGESNTKTDEKIEGPCTDGRTIYMPVLDPYWKDDNPKAIVWWGALIHETYHNLPGNS